jgi:hypothetical protein
MSLLEGGAKDLCHPEEGAIRDRHLLEEGAIHVHQHRLWGTRGEMYLLETAVLRLQVLLASYPFHRVGDLILVTGQSQGDTLASNLLGGIPTETEICGPTGMQRQGTEIDQGRDTTAGQPEGRHSGVMIGR